MLVADFVCLDTINRMSRVSSLETKISDVMNVAKYRLNLYEDKKVEHEFFSEPQNSGI